MVALILVVTTVVAVAGWRSVGRGPATEDADVLVPGDDLQEPVTEPGPPRCLVDERELECVTWRLDEQLRDAVTVGDRVVVLTSRGTVAGVDPATGAIDWATRTGLIQAFLIANTSRDRVLVRRDDTVSLFDTVSGTQVSQHYSDFVAFTADHLVLTDDGADTSADHVLVNDATTGQELGAWSLPSVDARIRGAGQHHLIVEDADRVLALVLATGRVAWEHVLADGEQVVRAGTEGILLQARSGDVIAIDELTGARLWTVPFPATLSAWRVPGADSMTAATSRDGNTYELVRFHPSTGREVWRAEITYPDPPNSTSVVGDGVALRWQEEVGTEGALHVIRPGSPESTAESVRFWITGASDPRIVSVEPLVVAHDDGLYGIEESAIGF